MVLVRKLLVVSEDILEVTLRVVGNLFATVSVEHAEEHLAVRKVEVRNMRVFLKISTSMVGIKSYDKRY